MAKEFQIHDKNNIPMKMEDIDALIASILNIEVDPKYYSSALCSFEDWKQLTGSDKIINYKLDQMRYQWFDRIGRIIADYSKTTHNLSWKYVIRELLNQTMPPDIYLKTSENSSKIGLKSKEFASDYFGYVCKLHLDNEFKIINKFIEMELIPVCLSNK